jgi:hypothetical protein
MVVFDILKGILGVIAAIMAIVLGIAIAIAAYPVYLVAALICRQPVLSPIGWLIEIIGDIVLGVIVSEVIGALFG